MSAHWLHLLILVVSSSIQVNTCRLNGSKPHIVFILFDDVGWNNVDWHNAAISSTRIKFGGIPSSTPNLLRMVQDGIELSMHYSYKMCAPSRSSIQSGRSPLHCTLRYDRPQLPIIHSSSSLQQTVCWQSAMCVAKWLFSMHGMRRNDDVVIPGAGIARNMTGMATILQKAGCV